MGAFDAVKPITIPNPDNPEESAMFRKKWRWEPHEQVIIKGTFTAVEKEEMENAGSVYSKKDKNLPLEAKLGTARRRLLEVMILDWTFAINGRKVVVSSEAIKRLPANYCTPILEVCDELASGMTEEEQGNFLPSANGHSQESLAEMNQSLTLS